MWLRRLRIASTTTFGVVCLILIVLWVGSYGKQHRQLHIDGIWWSSENGLLSWTTFEMFDESARDYPKEQIWVTLSRPPVSVELKWTMSVLGFRLFWQDRSFWIVELPYWLAVLPTSALAVGPWVKWSHRFSLRTLLIGMTLVAALLGLAVYMAGK